MKLRGTRRAISLGIVVIALVTSAMLAVPLASVYGAADDQGASAETWDSVPNVKIEVDGIDSGKTTTLPGGAISDVTYEVLPKDFPRREKMQLREAFVDVSGRRYAVGFVGGRDGKVYYSLKGVTGQDDLIVTSVADGSSVTLSFQDTTEPLTVQVNVGNNAAVDNDDDFSVLGLSDQELHAKGTGSSGTFQIAPGATQSFLVNKQLAQNITVTANGGSVKKITGDANTPVQEWEYTAPESGAGSISVSSSNATRTSRVTATMSMTGETTGGGLPNKPETNRMYGNTALAMYDLPTGKGVANDGYPSGNKTNFADPGNDAVSEITLLDGSKLSANPNTRKFYQSKGEKNGAGTIFGSSQAASITGTLDVTYDRSRAKNNTVLIDMVSTRCTPGNAAWAPQLAGVTINDVALPFNGFDWSTQHQGPWTWEQRLDSRVSNWITLGGAAKGTRARVVALGAWSRGQDDVGLNKFEFHHYIVELEDVTGPVNVTGVYITTANPQAVNVGSYGLETSVTRRSGSTVTYQTIATGSGIQAKDMITTGGVSGKSEVHLAAKPGYTLDGATAQYLNNSGTQENPKLTSETLGGVTYKKYELPGPQSQPGYRYFSAQGALVNYGVEYKENGGTFVEKPIDKKRYNVEGLTQITVAPQKPYKVTDEGTWVFTGYNLYDQDPQWGGQALQTGIQPGDKIDITKLKAKATSNSVTLYLWPMWQRTPIDETITAKVTFELQDGKGTVEHTTSKNVLLAKNAQYEFVSLPDSYEHNGKTYLLNRDASSLKPGTAGTTSGQEIGKAVYMRYADGVLKGAEHLKGKKVVTGKDAPELKADQFTFKIASDDAAAPLPAATEVKNKQDGTFAFGDIAFGTPGTYTYTITELQQGPEHFTFDTHELNITVEVTTPTTPGAPLAVAVKPVKEADRTFTNTYVKPAPKPATLTGADNLKGTKKLKGDKAPQLKQDQFTFEIKAVKPTDAPMPQQTTVKNDAQGNFNFGDITFDKAGEYTYEVREQKGADPEITYDTAVKTLKVKAAEPAVHGDPLVLTVEEGKNSFNFTNTFTDLPDYTNGTLSGSKDLAGTKQVTGAGAPKLKADQFSFRIEAVTKDAPLPNKTTVKNDDKGAFNFGDITFTAPGTYQYKITEVAGGLPYFSYDKHEVSVTVEVTDDASQLQEPLSVKVTKTGAMEFTNTYTKPAAGTLKVPRGTVELTGKGAPALTDDMFQFKIAAKSAGAPMPAKDTVGSKQDGTFDFGNISFADPGTYTYEIKQVPGQNIRVTYDDSVAVLEVTVKEPVAGQANAYTVTHTVKSGDLTFTNTYSNLPDYLPATLDGGKELAGTKRVTGEGAPAMQKGQFTFEIKAETPNAPMPKQATTTNDAAGAFNFGDITFSKPGTYQYKITEVAGDLPYFAYDTTEVAVTVTVTDDASKLNEPLGLSVTKKPALSFTNTYTKPGPGALAIPTGTVKLTGEGAPELTDGMFQFTITAKDEHAPMPQDATVASKADGSFDFGSLTFAEPGTYTYHIAQVRGDNPRITYDSQVAALEVTVEMPKAGQPNTYVATAKLVGGSLAFENTFRELDPGVLRVPTGSVELTGKDAPELARGQFSFKIEAVTPGAPLPSDPVVTNDGAGAFDFGEMAFDAAGTYEYVVTQVPGDDSRVTYDTHKVTLTVTVREPGMPTGKRAKRDAGLAYVVEYEVQGSMSFKNVFTAEQPEKPIEPEKPEKPETPEQPGRPAEPGKPGETPGTKPGGASGGKPATGSGERLAATGDPIAAGAVALVALAGAGAVAVGLRERRRR